MAITFAILAVTIVLFVRSRREPDLIALGSLLALFLFGVVDLDQALSGFSNPTVVLIGALFIVGEGLTRTGVTAFVGERLVGGGRPRPVRLLVATMAAAALLSGFVSNTGTVATLMPAVVIAAWGVGSRPSQFLIPLAFAANAGGLLTLAGTAPNIVIAEALDASGLRPFGFFEYAGIGLPLLAAAVLYMVIVGRRLLPRRRAGAPPVLLDHELGELADTYSLRGELVRMRVRVGSPLVGSTLRESDFGRRYGASVLQIEPAAPEGGLRRRLPDAVRDRLPSDADALPDPDQRLAVDDVLVVGGPPEVVERLVIECKLGLLPVADEGEELAELLSQEIGIAEVLLTPRSSYVGKAVAEGAIGRQYNVLVVGIRRGAQPVAATEALEFGDSLLVRGTWEAIGRMAEEPRNFVVVGRPEALARQVTEMNARSVTAVASLAGMVLLMVTGVVPTVVAALLAAGVMLAAGCLTTTQAYRAVSWSTVVLIAAMIPMAVALDATGGAEEIADAMVASLGSFGPTALLAGVIFVAMAFSQVVSNTAAAVLMSPIVLTAAEGLGVDPHPLMMGLAAAASASFLTPIATPTNLIVMVPGDYRFNDYARVGAPLALLSLVIAVIVIPVLWSF